MTSPIILRSTRAGRCRMLGILALLMLILTSCEKDLDIEYHDIDPLPVIEAELTGDGCRVAITLTTPMDEPMDRTRLTDASVILTDLSSGDQFPLQADPQGYFADPTPGIIGHEYQLTVKRAGSVYTARTIMFPPSEIISLEFNWINMPYDQVAVLQGLYLDPPSATGDCYWIKLFRNGEIYMWAEQDDRGATDGVATFFTMTSRRDTDQEDDDKVLVDGDVMTCTVSMISREMHDYLEALKNDSNGPSMFSGDRCLGYFLATSPVEKSVTFHPDDIPVYE